MKIIHAPSIAELTATRMEEAVAEIQAASEAKPGDQKLKALLEAEGGAEGVGSIEPLPLIPVASEEYSVSLACFNCGYGPGRVWIAVEQKGTEIDLQAEECPNCGCHTAGRMKGLGF